MCEVCGKRFEITNNMGCYCKKCAKKIKLENDRKIQKQRYNSRKQKILQRSNINDYSDFMFKNKNIKIS